MADFPMASLDSLRDLLNILTEAEVLAFQPVGELPSAPAMLLKGGAGVGKTHGIIDTAKRRLESNLYSVILFGEDVNYTDPWSALSAKLGLSSAIGHDELLDALNAAGETTGFPLIIFIDALNETEPDRKKWRSWLPILIEKVKRHLFLKVCFSCREIYLREVIPKSFSIPTVEHNGFLGFEYEAQFAFFQHYGVGVPAEPLLQEEFANPLFLRLVCEALQRSNGLGIPAGRDGIRALISMLLRTKNEHAASICDFDQRSNRVADAMLRLAGEMALSGTRFLPLERAKDLVDDRTPIYSKSLFAVLESESLIAVLDIPSEEFGGEPNYIVRFPFERIGDHLIAEHLLSKVTDFRLAFAIGGPLHFLFENEEASQANFGILEAVSIQLPETHRVELIDAVETTNRKSLMNAFIASLQWRAPHAVGKRTQQLVTEALRSNDTDVAAAEAILGIAARPGHPLNIDFLDRILSTLPLLERDPIWANILENSYSGWSSTIRQKSAVHRLIETARRGRLDGLDPRVAVSWATTLAWFCASPDRRIRDRATMAMTSIFVATHATIDELLQKFALCDDEYISERVVVAAYGSLLLTESTIDLHAAATTLYMAYFANGQPPLNASLRDHARLIIEMSLEQGVPPCNSDYSLYRPPYASNWPITLPAFDEVEPYIEDELRFPQMNLAERFGLATGTDFARYIIEPRAINSFDVQKASLDKLGIFLLVS